MKRSKLSRMMERIEAARLYRDQQRISKLAALIPDQASLNRMLLDIPNRIQRREVYELYKPHLRFESVFEGEVKIYHRREESVQEIIDRNRNDPGIDPMAHLLVHFDHPAR